MTYSKCIFFIICAGLFSSLSLAQNSAITGIVLNTDKTPIEGCTIILKEGSTILGYTHTNNDGSYNIEINNNNLNSITITAHLLGYKKQTQTLKINSDTKLNNLSFILTEKVETLNEVVLHPSAKIKREDDKIIYRADAFKNGSEDTVEDLLKKLPGIEVLDNGKIKAHGRYIDKLLVEGDDMFDQNYTMLSKNLDAKVLDNIEILEGFEDNPVLKKAIGSSKVAINLTLKNEYKNIWFGNISLGLGTNDRYKASSNIGLIRKKIKFFNFNNLENLGAKAKDQIVINEINDDSRFDSKKSNALEPIFQNPDNSISYLKDNEASINKAFINSLSFVKKVNSNLKFRGNGFWAQDNQIQNAYTSRIFNTENIIINNEFNNLDVKDKTFGFDLELSHTNGIKSYLNNNLYIKSSPSKTHQNILFNNQNIEQATQQTNVSFLNHLNFSKLLLNNKLLHTYFFIGLKDISQHVILSSPLLNNFLNQNDNLLILNNSNDKSWLYGLNSVYSFNAIKNTQFINTLGIISKDIKRQNNFKFNNNTVLDTLSNNTSYRNFDIFLKTKFKNELSKKVELYGHIAFNYLNVSNANNKHRGLLFNPRIGFRIKKLKIGTFSFEYSRDFIIPESNLFTRNYQLYSFNSFVKGTNNIQIIKRNKFRFNYQVANDLQTKSISFKAQYTTSDQRYSSSNTINENFSFKDYELANGGENLIIKTEFVSYFKKLNISTSFGTLQNLSITPLKINSNNFEELTYHTAKYYINGRTFFKMPFNFNIKLSLIENKSKINNRKNSSNWFNFNINSNIKFSKSVVGVIKNNTYLIRNKGFNFTDIEFKYMPEKSKFSYDFRISNLTNQRHFVLNNISEFSSFQSSAPLIPRYIFVAVKYRF